MYSLHHSNAFLTPTLPTLPSHHPHTLPQESPDDALRIFTEDIVEVESLPRQLVLDHLTSVAVDLTMPYLVSAWDVCELNAYQSETQTMVWVCTRLNACTCSLPQKYIWLILFAMEVAKCKLNA